jgi:regulator of protease activity HflC (stomatin/prohibitin superfamily)
MEKDYKSMPGYTGIIVVIILIIIGVTAAINNLIAILVPSIICFILCLPGFMIVNPNESKVLTLFGKYKGTIKENGFKWVNPFFIKLKISLRAKNLNSEPIKVNDKLGNPIMIGVVLVWKVADTFKAAFDVENFEKFVNVQSESAIRKLAGHYAYDDIEDKDAQITLRSGGDEVNKMLEKELTERLTIAGIEIIEAKISYLAYSEEIAGAMLQRQQATAIVAARQKIVEGAVTMVEMALEQLSNKGIVKFDEEKKATMVSNLMVVLCSERAAQPVLNTGSFHQ